MRLLLLLLGVVCLLWAWDASVCTPSSLLPSNGVRGSQCDGTAFFLISKPSEIARQIHAGTIDQEQLFGSALNTLVNSGLALALTTICSLFWYFLSTRYFAVRRAGYVLLWTFQVVPYIAFAWVFSLIFGAFDKLAFAFVISVFPVIGSLFVAIKEMPADVREVLMLSGATHTTMTRHLFLPKATPFFFGGLHVAAPLTVVGAMLADMSGGDSVGLGREVLLAARNMRPAELWVYTAAAVAISMILSGAVWGCEAIFAARNPWYSRGGENGNRAKPT